MLAFELRIESLFLVKTLKLDRKISYRIEIRNVEVQSDNVIGDTMNCWLSIGAIM